MALRRDLDRFSSYTFGELVEELVEMEEKILKLEDHILQLQDSIYDKDEYIRQVIELT